MRPPGRPGDIAFDAGSNAGAFAMQMSRQAGPRGIIRASDANPRIIGHTQHAPVQGGANNVTLHHRAIWHRGGDRPARPTPPVAIPPTPPVAIPPWTATSRSSRWACRRG